SYCRCVASTRESNGKKKGEGNKKAGNKYLSWAFSEAAHFAVRYDARIKAFYERKRQKRNGIVAIRAIDTVTFIGQLCGTEDFVECVSIWGH
ncbi:transposase, partial [Vibrio albus]|uniref:transposase n=1 Tax=Vibrio albus TaxID=2200953 RepID=UPI001C63A4E0